MKLGSQVIAVAATALLWGQLAHSAEVYMWQGDEGTAHYGDKPPQDGRPVVLVQLSDSPTPESIADAFERRERLLDAARKARLRRLEIQEVGPEQIAAHQEQRCRELTERLYALVQPQPYLLTNIDGTTEYGTLEDKYALYRETERKIQESSCP